MQVSWHTFCLKESHIKKSRYDAHIYTDKELQDFFVAVDKSQSLTGSCPYRADVMPVFFRILYTSGIHGKGNKYRTVVLADTTAKLIENYINRYRSYAVGTDTLITNRYQRKIDRDGISYIIKKYVNALHKEDSTFPEHVHCHMFRHSKAMHMLEANINIVYIRDFLGHEDISTTMVYARADNRLKNDVISVLAPKIAGEHDLPDWNKDRDLLQFLNSLK